MSYVDEVIDLIVKENPDEPEFHQAVKEVLESLRVVIEENEEQYRKDALLERLVNPERQRQRSSTSEHRLQSTIQQCDWTLQRRSPFPPFRKCWYY